MIWSETDLKTNADKATDVILKRKKLPSVAEVLIWDIIYRYTVSSTNLAGFSVNNDLKWSIVYVIVVYQHLF
jgi:hypothetical protein